MSRALPSLVLTSLLALPAAAADEADEAPDATRKVRVARASGEAMGAPVELLVAVPTEVDGRMATAHLPDAVAEMNRVQALLDPSEGQLAQLAAAAGSNPVPLDAELFALLDEAMRIARLSKGAVDPAGGAYRELELNPATRTAKLERAGTHASLDAAARGYALNRAAKLLEGRGVKNFVLSLGGDLAVRGKKGDAPWTIGLQDPGAPGHWAAMSATEGAVVTVSAPPGEKGEKARSAAVVAGDAVTAQLLAEAVFRLGADAGLRLVRRVRGAEVAVITADNKVRVSKGLARKLKYRQPSP